MKGQLIVDFLHGIMAFLKHGFSSNYVISQVYRLSYLVYVDDGATLVPEGDHGCPPTETQCDCYKVINSSVHSWEKVQRCL